MHENTTGISRRSFLKGAAVTASMAAVAGSVTACAPQDTGSASATGTAAATSTWKTAPAEVTDFTQEITCDAVVCGDGFAGVTCFRELAEEGYKVYMIDKQTEDGYAATGNEFASLNAAVLQERGVPHIEPVDFFRNFMTITGNIPNQELVMKFAQNSELNSNWYLSECTADDLATMTTAFFPQTEHQMDHLGVIRFWPSVCSFYGDCNQTKLQGYNRSVGVKKGGTALFGTEAQYIIMEDGKVKGLVAKDENGYIRFTCKAVITACGGFGGNVEMMNDLIPDMAGACVEGEQLSSMSGNDGRGVRMAYWAGAHLETTPVAGMNMKGLSVPGKMNVLPQALWIDENGKRFCNEYYPTSEQRGYQDVFKTRKTKVAVVDSNFPTYRQYTLPQHAGFTASTDNITSLQQSLDKAYAKFKGTYVETSTDSSAQQQGPMVSVDYIADDTLEGLAGQLGYTGDAAKTFVASVTRYNEMCAQGRDDDFGRDPAVLFPVEQAPFYACTFDPELGETMVTMGGILTDGNQNAVDKDYEPIPGLYVTGNDCGRRFGIEYITPIPGCSLAFAIVLGRECGKSVGAFLAS